MMAEHDILTNYQTLKASILKKMGSNQRCILVIGSKRCGKSSFINFVSGYNYTSEMNDEGGLFLQQKSKPEQQPDRLQYGEMKQLMITIYQAWDQSLERINIIQMPAFISLDEGGQDQSEILISIIYTVLFTIFVWNVVLSAAKKVHICLVTPIEVIMQDSKLLQFFEELYKCFNDEQNVKKKLDNCISMIVSKAEYQDDAQNASQKLSNLVHTQFGNRVNFSQIINRKRIYCFLASESFDGDGNDLLKKIIQQNDFQDVSQCQLMKANWKQLFIDSIIKDKRFYQSKQMIQNVKEMYNMFLASDQKTNLFFCKCLDVLGIVSLLKFLQNIKKQKQLNAIQSNLQIIFSKNVYNLPKQYEQLVNNAIGSGQLNQQKSVEHVEHYLKLLQRIHKLLQQQQSTSLMWQSVVSLFGQQFSESDRWLMKKWINIQQLVWVMIGQFQKVCNREADENKGNSMIQENMMEVRNINKQVVLKFKNVALNRIKDGFKHFQLFRKLNNVKEIKDLEEFKLLNDIFSDNDQKEIVEEIQQSQKSGVITSSDPRITRWYFPTGQKSDLFREVAERSKKIVVSLKLQNEVKRDDIKDMLSRIQKQPNNRDEHVQKLANIFIKYQFYQHALQALMDAGHPGPLYSFLTSQYLRHVEDSEQKKVYVEFIVSYLIQYLQYRSFIYDNYRDANGFLYCLQACYDFLDSNFAETAQQHMEILNLSKGLVIPTQKQQVQFRNEDQRFPKIQNRSKDMPCLRYVSLSKSQILEEFINRQELKKKNLSLLSEKKKCYLAAQQIFKFQ